MSCHQLRWRKGIDRASLYGKKGNFSLIHINFEESVRHKSGDFDEAVG